MSIMINLITTTITITITIKIISRSYYYIMYYDPIGFYCNAHNYRIFIIVIGHNIINKYSLTNDKCIYKYK